MKKILVIDDEEWLREMMLLALRQRGFEVLEAENGEKGIEVARKEIPDLILCDVNMVKVNGLELKKRIFDDEVLRLKCVPFIFMSTGRASSEVMKAYSYGVQGYFVKPTSFGKLKEMLQHIIWYWRDSQRPNV